MGAEKGVFMSEWQRSLYNEAGLTARPFWTHKQTGYQHYIKVMAHFNFYFDVLNSNKFCVHWVAVKIESAYFCFLWIGIEKVLEILVCEGGSIVLKDVDLIVRH